MEHNEDESMSLKRIVGEGSAKMPYELPEGYFEGLSKEMLDAVKGDALISEASKKMPYDLPEGYFEGLPGAIYDKATRRRGGFLFSLQRSSISRTAIAAGIGLLIVASGVWYLSQRPGGIEREIRNIPKSEV